MPFTQSLSSSTYSLGLVTISDLPEIAEIMVQAMSQDTFWGGMKGTITPEEEYQFTYEMLLPQVVNGGQMGAYEGWKVVDEHGRILAWAGLSKPVSLTEEQKKMATAAFQFPQGRNQALYDFFQNRVLPSAGKNGCDASRHFQRQNTMVRPEYQRQGLGRLLTEKCNEVADAAGAVTYVCARPGAAGLFAQMGFETLERLDFDLNDYGVQGGKTALFVMRRDSGAQNQRGQKLDWS
ncbi:uncharacterized protein PAC_15340 [Phialocephala subalpina]|uniref:N-acetyltransferase domain-containing protein n=1 Tax=Phialocephala subalpina TaxID=576137 RepID=A0A1L7XK54_9HELO|nr:uncharacterized protein PAC_15340 [Phialocephala subalpina]